MIPLAATTSLLALFSSGCLNIDRTRGPETTVLIWGGSCTSPSHFKIQPANNTPASVGQYAIQLARLYSLRIITTSSPKHFDLVRSLGADEVLDYRDEQVVIKIRQLAPGLRHIFDTIGLPESLTISSQILRDGGRVLCTVRPGEANTEGVAADQGDGCIGVDCISEGT